MLQKLSAELRNRSNFKELRWAFACLDITDPAIEEAAKEYASGGFDQNPFSYTEELRMLILRLEDTNFRAEPVQVEVLLRLLGLEGKKLLLVKRGKPDFEDK